MITLFTGAPGAGKTAAMVELISSLKDGRLLYVDGLNDFALEHYRVDGNSWHTELPDGAILIIDEVQRLWRPRASSARVPDSVSALETHRHRGIDIFLTTQAPALVDVNVRNLVGRHVHIRDTGILGRYWYEWPEISANMNWRTCINKRKYKLPKQVFDLYKSASLHTKPVRGVPKILYVGVLSFVVFLVLCFVAWRTFARNQIPVPVKPLPAEPVAAVSASHPVNSDFDERIAFIPRISNRPETAPAYDKLRVVSSMPRVVGGHCVGDECRCYNQQGRDAGLSSRDCQTWISNPPFDPYLLPVPSTGALGASPAATPGAAPSGVPVAPPASGHAPALSS